jgi:hypothetical protein
MPRKRRRATDVCPDAGGGVGVNSGTAHLGAAAAPGHPALPAQSCSSVDSLPERGIKFTITPNEIKRIDEKAELSSARPCQGKLPKGEASGAVTALGAVGNNIARKSGAGNRAEEVGPQTAAPHTTSAEPRNSCHPHQPSLSLQLKSGPPFPLKTASRSSLPLYRNSSIPLLGFGDDTAPTNPQRAFGDIIAVCLHLASSGRVAFPGIPLQRPIAPIASITGHPSLGVDRQPREAELQVVTARRGAARIRELGAQLTATASEPSLATG